MLTGRAILFALVFFNVFMGGLHLASILGLAGGPWGGAPFAWRAADVVFLLADTSVVALVFGGKRAGAALMALVAAARAALFLGAVPALSPAAAPYGLGAGAADSLAGLSLVALGLIGLAMVFMKDGWARETPPACG